MTSRLLIGAAVLVVAIAGAWLLNRRRPVGTAPRDRFAIPRQLHRADFPRPDAPWLVVLWSSTTCDSCATMAPKVAAMESPEVATAEVEYTAQPALHRRYGIEAVPLVLVVDADGVVRTSLEGPTTATDLWAAVAGVRDPDTTPEPPPG